MKRKRIRTVVTVVVSLTVAMLAVSGGRAIYAQDTAQAKYTVQVPNGLAFSEFRGYESWQTVSISGSRMAKIHWNPKKLETFPGTMVPGTLHDLDFMVKDSKRFADSGGWGWAAFKYDAASDTFTPATTADQPPQGNDAKCGLACHTIVRTRDYVFTDYGKR